MKNFRLMNKNKIYLLVILLLLLIIGTGYASLYSSLGMQGSIKVAKDRTLYNVLARSATLDTNVSFSSSNVTTGIYEVSSTKSDTNPVYYYRGSVTNNNVKFANFCWKIVRTTSTGGVKLIYNGVPSSTGSCNNTGTASQIGTSKFNDLHTSVAYSGYMYGDVYESKKENMANFSKENYMGSDPNKQQTMYQTFTYAYFNNKDSIKFGQSSSPYAVGGTSIDASDWSTKYTLVTNANGLRYTRFGAISGYQSYGMNYIYYGDATNVYYVSLVKSDQYSYLYTPTEVLNQMTTESTNTTDSTIKKSVDTWYENNMTSYTSKLEDTVWCNDRSVTTYNGWKDANSAASPYLYYGPRYRLVSQYKPNLSCNKNDSFTTGSDGNAKSKYPVGLLTADEYSYSGGKHATSNTTNYLYTGQNYWTMSPYLFFYNYACNYAVQSSGSISYNYVDFAFGVRPVISLKSGTKYTSGTGEYANPYIVE